MFLIKKSVIFNVFRILLVYNKVSDRNIDFFSILKI